MQDEISNDGMTLPGVGLRLPPQMPPVARTKIVSGPAQVEGPGLQSLHYCDTHECYYYPAE